MRFFFASGFYLTGTATSLAQLYIYYGLIAGLGQGFAYSGCLSNTLRLFPDKRGLASGIITGGMGLAAVFASPIANSLILSHDAQYAFRTIGLAYIVIVLVASVFVQKAPAGYKPDGWNPPTSSAQNVVNKTWIDMLKTPVFLRCYCDVFLSELFQDFMIAFKCSDDWHVNVWAFGNGRRSLCITLFNC